MYATTANTAFRTASELNTAMAGVYKNMMLAVGTSMIVSYLVSTSMFLMMLLFSTPLKWVVIFAPLVAIFAITYGIDRVSKPTAIMMLHGFAALMGLSMATIFSVFTATSIVTAFMGAAILFGVMSFYGYFTKKDLSGWGSFLAVGLIAIILASVVNIGLATFWPALVNNALVSTVISSLAIIIFTGLTAYDTQRIREAISVSSPGNAEVSGALILYVNFINLFMALLQVFGNKE